MSPLKTKIDALKSKGFFDQLKINRGIEKEFFRVNSDGHIANSIHPVPLGSAMTNRYITTDFAEAQTELVTPIFTNSVDDLYDFLFSLHVYIAKNINATEFLWPFSMPPRINNESDINIAHYHNSNSGFIKHLYRKGLAIRYGPTMQCVSGLHYNFSIDKISLKSLNALSNSVALDDEYLGMIRNFKRNFWFVLFHFGETNIVDKSFVKDRLHNLETLNENDMHLKYATSLRMSKIGYQSEAQQNLQIKYNSLDSFLKKIKDAITIPHPEFHNKGHKDENGDYQQISTGIIQIENEYYDSIRPKRSPTKNLRPYHLLKKFGIEYVEIRGVDLSPNDITGISKESIRFLDLILLYCLICPSPKISSDEKTQIDKNDYAAIYEGRNENTKIFIDDVEKEISEASEEIINDLKLIASHLNNSELFLNAIEEVSLSLKGQPLSENFHNEGITLAKKNTNILRKTDGKNIDRIKKEAELSLERLDRIPQNTNEEMNEFIKQYNMNL
ncbi:MAG: glutamate--cysteine ligase [Gammaproteobacteria bacterium]|nr:glutamate--cysteine ligase [Gammaproteobacteria bacterium]|tara:strand:- start:714 stop:2216 length:1503 start_codon:yes stop_codon:yes gene_type:complete